MRFPWLYDEAKQHFVTPMGIIRLADLANSKYEAICGNYTFTTGAWAGWRIRGKWLRGSTHGKKVSISPTELAWIVQKAGLSVDGVRRLEPDAMPAQLSFPFILEEESVYAGVTPAPLARTSA